MQGDLGRRLKGGRMADTQAANDLCPRLLLITATQKCDCEWVPSTAVRFAHSGLRATGQGKGSSSKHCCVPALPRASPEICIADPVWFCYKVTGDNRALPKTEQPSVLESKQLSIHCVLFASQGGGFPLHHLSIPKESCSSSN